MSALPDTLAFPDTSPGCERRDRSGVVRRAAWALAGVLLAVVAVGALPGLDEVRERLSGVAAGWVAVVLLLEAASMAAFVAVFHGVFGRGLARRLSTRLGLAAQGGNALVSAGGAGGLALGAWALRRRGRSGDEVARRLVAFFVVTSAVNFAAAVLAGGAVAVGLPLGEAPLALAVGPAALALAAMTAAVVVARLPPAGPARPGRAARAVSAGRTALTGGLAEAGRLLRSGDPAVLAGAVGYMAFDVAALAAAFEAVGSAPPAGVLLLGYVVGQLGGLLPLPGGVGGADGGLIAALALYGAPVGEAAAAVLVYRTFQLGLPALVGGLAAVRLPSRAAALTVDG